MSQIVDEVVGANQKYAREFGAKGELALPPARQFARGERLPQLSVARLVAIAPHAGRLHGP